MITTRLREAATQYCTNLGHQLTQFKRLPSLDTSSITSPWIARCERCGRHVIVSGTSGRFSPASGKHGTAPLVACPNQRSTA